MTQVPYLDLSRSRKRIAAGVEARWASILRENAYILGSEVSAFEEEFAAFLGAAGVAGVGNGTDALVVGLRTLGLRPGDEVLVPAFSFFATAEAVVWAGGKPVFCDVETETWNLDPAELERRKTPRTVGVIGVHLYGHPFASEIVEFCRREGLFLLEDAAQAHGARLEGRAVGTLGQLAAWSFYPTKNLGAWGDGGALSGPDRELVERARRIANHGQTSRYHHVEVGTNSRLDALQAAVLRERLRHLEEDNRNRRRLALQYRALLDGVGDLLLPRERGGSESVYHQYAVRTRARDELQRYLGQRGIGSSIHYPSPLHRQPALRSWCPEEIDFPNAEAASRELLCLPMYAELTETEVEQVAAAIRDFYRS